MPFKCIIVNYNKLKILKLPTYLKCKCNSLVPNFQFEFNYYYLYFYIYFQLYSFFFFYYCFRVHLLEIV